MAAGNIMSVPANLIEAARATPIEGVAEQHSLKLRRAGAERIGPCPICGGTDRFAISVTKQLFNCRCCGGRGDVIALEMLVTGCDFRTAVETLSGEHVDVPAPDKPRQAHVLETPKPSPDDSSAYALSLWKAAVDPGGTLAEAYLASRGLALDSGIAGEVVRWHPGIGAMLALFRGIRTDAPRAISRTFLDREARKIGRKFLGPVSGCAIKLDDTEVLGGLHVCEGIESGLAARAIGLRPTWALGSAGAIAAFQILSGVETLNLLAEPDDASAKAIETCARRWHDAGLEALVIEPTVGDMNDAIRRTA